MHEKGDRLNPLNPFLCQLTHISSSHCGVSRRESPKHLHRWFAGKFDWFCFLPALQKKKTKYFISHKLISFANCRGASDEWALRKYHPELCDSGKKRIPVCIFPWLFGGQPDPSTIPITYALLFD